MKDYICTNRETGCWEWTRGRSDTGYGVLYDRQKGKTVIAHRWVYSILVGPIGPGMTLDHLCRNRACVRPDHLEPVTNKENIRRGSAPNIVVSRTGVCQRGHSNLYTRKDGRGKQCQICNVLANKLRLRNKKEKKEMAIAT